MRLPYSSSPCEGATRPHMYIGLRALAYDASLQTGRLHLAFCPRRRRKRPTGRNWPL